LNSSSCRDYFFVVAVVVAVVLPHLCLVHLMFVVVGISS
jgi:hypothetical protein